MVVGTLLQANNKKVKNIELKRWIGLNSRWITVGYSYSRGHEER